MEKKLVQINLALIVLLLSFSSIYADNNTKDAKGIVTGTVYDKESGETLIQAAVVVLDTKPFIGTSTDLDGKYHIELEPGTYSLKFTYVGKQELIQENISIEAGEIMELDAILSSDSRILNEVVVKGERSAARNEMAILSLQAKAATVQDGISARQMSLLATSSAATAMKSVTGASVVDGEVYVRGLSDRYLMAQINGMPLPSTNPYRNTPQIDLIPSNLLDNIIASKTFPPDQPGSFSGGNVNLRTKSFPTRFTVSASFSTSLNTQSSFKSNFLTHDGGNTDWLGYDDGFREIPTIFTDTTVLLQLTGSLPNRARHNEDLANLADEAVKALNSQKAPSTKSVPMNYGMSFSIGNKKQLGGNPFGFLFGFRYKQTYNAYDEGIFQYWELPGAGASGLNNNFDLRETQGTENPQLGGLLNLSYKIGTLNKLSFNVLYNHLAQKNSSYQGGLHPGILSGGEFETRRLQFQEREIQSYQLTGEHTFPSLNNAKIEWGTNYIRSEQDEPDLRFFANSFRVRDNDLTDTLFSISSSEYDLPFHFFRNLTDEQLGGKMDIILPFLSKKNTSNKIKIGFSYSDKSRNFTEARFQIQNSSGAERYNGNADLHFAPANVGIANFDPDKERYTFGLYATDETIAANNYSGNEKVMAGYGMLTYNLNKLQITTGARLENTNIQVESADESAEIGEIKQLDVLPSMNLTYKLLPDKMNLRAAFSQTLARPNMRELAPFSAVDFIGGFRYTGNPALERTLIQNYDLRWEWFPKPGEVVAVSGYYKNFMNPIVRSFIPEASNPEIQFQNVANAQVFGVELELRKNLGFIGEAFKNFRFATNLSLIHSFVDIPEDELAQICPLNSEFCNGTRPFQGQSPYLFNANLGYASPRIGLDALLSFNIFGARLSEISSEGTPDIYETPRPQLDFTISKRLANNFSAKFGVQNILNSTFKRVMYYRPNAETDYSEYLIQDFKRGTNFSFSLSYKIN